MGRSWMAKTRARVKVKGGATRAQQAAEFSRKKAKLRMKHLKRRGLMAGAIVAVAYVGIGGWWLHHSGRLARAVEVASGTWWNMTASAGFEVKQVYLSGRQHADANMVKAALDVHPGEPIMQLDLAGIQKRLEAIPEVKTAMLSRELPANLRIVLTEREPAAVWQHGGNRMLLDADGVVLSSTKYPNVGELPLVVGEDAPKHVQEFTALLDAVPSLRQEVGAAVRVGDRRWNVQMKRGLTVMLPEHDPAAAWQRFAELVRKDALFTKSIRSVDMRLEDRVFILPGDENAAPVTLTSAKEI